MINQAFQYILKHRLHDLKSWWSSHSWFGGQKSFLRQEIWQTFSQELEIQHITPVYKLVLQLLICKTVDIAYRDKVSKTLLPIQHTHAILGVHIVQVKFYNPFLIKKINYFYFRR